LARNLDIIEGFDPHSFSRPEYLSLLVPFASDQHNVAWPGFPNCGSDGGAAITDFAR
jgi:hypothetical protein